jgi:hypothetical protein
LRANWLGDKAAANDFAKKSTVMLNPQLRIKPY